MTELGRRFLNALRGQGFGVIFQGGDAVVLAPDGAWRHHIPAVILADDEQEALLLLAIVALTESHREVSLRWLNGREEPGRN